MKHQRLGNDHMRFLFNQIGIMKDIVLDETVPISLEIRNDRDDDRFLMTVTDRNTFLELFNGKDTVKHWSVPTKDLMDRLAIDEQDRSVGFIVDDGERDVASMYVGLDRDGDLTYFLNAGYEGKLRYILGGGC